MAAVIFDFDGVIADSEPIHLGAFRDAFEARGWPLDAERYFDRYLGFGDRDLVQAYGKDYDLRLDEAVVSAVLQDKEAAFARRLGSGAVLFRGARSCIERLSARFALAIASGALRAEIEHVLQANDLRHHFPVIVSIDDVGRGKPAPDPYLQASAGLGESPEHCVAIEDSEGGIESAVAAGLLVIGVTTSRPAAALSRAHTVVSSLDQITAEGVARLLGSRGL